MDRAKAPVFVVGSPRSGTTLLYHTILSSGNFAVYQAESDVFNRIAPAFGNLRSQANRKRLMKMWLESDYFERTGLDAGIVRERVLSECGNAGDFLRIVMELMARKQGVERWADNTPTHLLHIPHIQATIPNALFVHMIRDGRDVAISMNRLGWGGYRFPWDREHGLAVSGLYWEWLVRNGREYGRKLGASYLEVRYEELVQQPRATLKDLSAFLCHDLDFERIQRNAIGAVRAPNSSFHNAALNSIERRKEIGFAVASRLDGLLGPLLEELGYPVERSAKLDFTARRLRAFYPRYRALRQKVKQSPIGKHFVCRALLRPGALNRALSVWEAFSVHPATGENCLVQER